MGIRQVNKKWTYEDKETHVVLRWKSFEVLIDHDDFHFFEERVLRIIGSESKNYYLYIVSYSGGCYSYETFHRVIMNLNNDYIVDHINSNSLDNRKSNLRVCTHSDNMANSRKIKGKSSVYKGVSFDKKSGLWMCRITKNSVIERYSFKEEISAAIKYNERAVILFGEFARLNHIEKDIALT